MHRWYRVLSLILLVASPVLADERVPVVMSEAVKTACGECHMVYPPQMLPRASWQTIMDTLSDHFGESATLAEAVRDTVRTYLLEHAADTDRSKAARQFARGLDPRNPPLRITATPWFLKEHRKMTTNVWQRSTIKSRANCAACHPGAGQGNYETTRIPQEPG